MYSTEGRLSIQEVRGLYAAAVLLGMEGTTDRQIAHHAVIDRIQALLEQPATCAIVPTRSERM